MDPSCRCWAFPRPCLQRGPPPRTRTASDQNPLPNYLCLAWPVSGPSLIMQARARVGLDPWKDCISLLFPGLGSAQQCILQRGAARVRTESTNLCSCPGGKWGSLGVSSGDTSQSFGGHCPDLWRTMARASTGPGRSRAGPPVPLTSLIPFLQVPGLLFRSTPPCSTQCPCRRRIDPLLLGLWRVHSGGF